MHRGKKTKELLAIVSLSVFVFFGLIGTSTATVIYEDVGFLVAPEGGPEFVFDINSFTITDAGAYKATLTDFGSASSWLEPFDLLALEISTSTKLFGDRLGSGSFWFHVAPEETGNFWASVIGDPGGGLEHRPFRGAGSHDP
jgi:hypothetical protein